MDQKTNKSKSSASKRRGLGITVKLVAAVVVSVIIAVSALLAVVYQRMSQTLLDKSNEMLYVTMERTNEETQTWMNHTLAMLESQRDTIQYENMENLELTEYIKHTAGQQEA